MKTFAAAALALTTLFMGSVVYAKDATPADHETKIHKDTFLGLQTGERRLERRKLPLYDEEQKPKSGKHGKPTIKNGPHPAKPQPTVQQGSQNTKDDPNVVKALKIAQSQATANKGVKTETASRDEKREMVKTIRAQIHQPK